MRASVRTCRAFAHADDSDPIPGHCCDMDLGRGRLSSPFRWWGRCFQFALRTGGDVVTALGSTDEVKTNDGDVRERLRRLAAEPVRMLTIVSPPGFGSYSQRWQQLANRTCSPTRSAWLPYGTDIVGDLPGYASGPHAQAAKQPLRSMRAQRMSVNVPGASTYGAATPPLPYGSVRGVARSKFVLGHVNQSDAGSSDPLWTW